jgi:Transglutaminase-like superfamily
MVPFSLMAQRGCTSPAGLALSLTAEFAPLRAERAEAALDELAEWLSGGRDDGPEGQLHAAADMAGAHLEPLALDCAIDDLLLDRVVIGRAGHPLLLAVATVEAGRRAGLALGIVAGADGAFVAHQRLPDPLMLDPGTGRVFDVRSLGKPVAWQCAHQVSARILNRIGERAERVGHVAWALRAAELRLALPFEDSARERLEAELRRVRARLN